MAGRVKACSERVEFDRKLIGSQRLKMGLRLRLVESLPWLGLSSEVSEEDRKRGQEFLDFVRLGGKLTFGDPDGVEPRVDRAEDMSTEGVLDL